MATLIRLLGSPKIESEGIAAVGPRGNKAWGLLAYLVLGRSPPSRRQLAELLFADADDPLGALRWNLAELRRVLAQPDAFTGDPVQTRLKPGTEVDVQRLLTASPEEVVYLDGLGGELLEGISFSACPAFEAWLLPQRRQLAMVVEAVLRERALLALAAGRPQEASDSAVRLVAANPFEEGHHELLIRSLLAAGEHAAAGNHVLSCEALFRRELGTEPSRRLRDLVRMQTPSFGTQRVGGPAAAQAQLEAGRAALAAGAVEVGIEFLRRARREAAGARDELLEIQALLALGSALVHTMRSHEEGAAVLHEAAAAALRLGTCSHAATAYREIGFIDVQAGRRERAEVWLARAEAAACGASAELASIGAVRGMNHSDAASYPEAIAALEHSVEHAHRCEGRNQLALSTSLLGRVHLLRGDAPAARRMLEQSLRFAESAQWIAFRPWPEALAAEIDLLDGRADVARGKLEHAFTIACQLGDSCWEGVTARGLGLVEASCRREDQSRAWLIDARARCTRSAAPYQWVHGWILDALCAVTPFQAEADLAEWIGALEALAQRTGMRELLVRACLHRHRIGDSQALRSARLLAADIENPLLQDSMAGA
jgi:DNA-binding SARP family transcriptional activator